MKLTIFDKNNRRNDISKNRRSLGLYQQKNREYFILKHLEKRERNHS